MEQAIEFESAGLTLRGVLHAPEAGATPRPALILCHGFGGSCRGAGHPELARALAGAGYVALRFDFRGCGQSAGERGSVICAEEAEDLRAAIDFLAAQPAVDPQRVGVIGASLGGSVAIEVAAEDARVKVCVANGAIGNGERRFRAQYPDAEKWQEFLNRLDEAKRVRAQTGHSVMFYRFDVVHIPERDRAGLPPGAIMEFTAETARSLLASAPEQVIGKIAPRPVLLVHARGDGVVPVAETEAMAAAAGPTCEKHIIETHEHFSAGSPALAGIVLDFLERKLPAA
jgi:hypothetical protein